MAEKIEKLCSKRCRIFLQGMILCILIANVFYQGARKEGYFGDELYSYHYVNQVEYPYITENRGENTWMNSWHDASYFLDYLTITGDEAFDLAGTYQSICQDVHPPLFYMLLELSCSVFSIFFPGAFSKWCGILINILFFVLTVAVLYKLAKYLTESDFTATMVCILYGLSTGAASTVVFIRMYMVLTFCCVLFTYLNVLFWKRLWNGDKFSGAGLDTALFCSTVLGVLTHYYFFIYAFFICAFIWIYSLLVKKYRFSLKYALTMAAGILAGYLIWPDMRHDIFKGYRGTEAFDNFSGSTDWEAFREFFSIISRELFGGVGLLVLLFFILSLCCLVLAIWWRAGKYVTEEGSIHIFFEKKEKERRMEIHFTVRDIAVIQIIVTVMFYVLLISKIAPYQEDRYIFNVFPMVILGVVYIAGKIFGFLAPSRLPYVITLFIMLCFTVFGYLSTGVNYLYEGTGKKLEVVDNYPDIPVVYINNGSTFRACGDSVYFSKAKYTYPIREEGIDGLAEVLESKKETEVLQCLIYIDLAFSDVDMVLERVKEELDTENIRMLFQTEYSAVYLME